MDELLIHCFSTLQAVFTWGKSYKKKSFLHSCQKLDVITAWHMKNLTDSESREPWACQVTWVILHQAI